MDTELLKATCQLSSLLNHPDRIEGSIPLQAPRYVANRLPLFQGALRINKLQDIRGSIEDNFA
jgi:hypothetical protein